ncbi:MAG TPA: L-2-hydroxyglutarate oxidase, partial [Symbiobacteriaceae bacterium]|nr:L-2-hydroxyglutarate oxidase [Symbiobacteriaceae bacterium]
VIHGGIYYAPGSLKARLCVEGARRMETFCEQHGLAYRRIGKVIVATSEQERPRLEELWRRGEANGVPGLRRIGPEELRELEPNVAGVEALHSPTTGIVDFAEVARAMAAELRRQGAEVITGAEVLAIDRGSIQTTRAEVHTRFLVNCAGLHSDRIARLAGLTPPLQIVPVRGEYYFMRPESGSLVQGLIYPVPDPALPFLGVHFTRTIHGQVEAGPNAVPAFAREGYSAGRVNLADLREMLGYPGFRAMARRLWRVGLYEFYRSASKAAFVRSLQKLVPAIRSHDLVRGGAGVRAQAVAPDGALVNDFSILEGPGAVHVLNAPSPAATASLAIGGHIARMALLRLGD